MTDVVLEFMSHLRNVWKTLPVVVSSAAEGLSESHVKVDIKRWVQTPLGCEVTLNVMYVPNATQPMPEMLKWLQAFYAFIQTKESFDLRLTWQGQTAEFLTDPLRISCAVNVRCEAEVV